MTAPAQDPRAPGGRRARRTLVLIALVVAAPVLLSYGFYYFAPPGRFTNYGELLATQPFPAMRGTRVSDGAAVDVASLRGRWVVVVAAPAACDEACAKVLYATRQARTIQGKESDRVQRVWLATGPGRLPRELIAEHPDLLVLRTADEAAAALPKGADAIHLVDPIGNQVLAWPRDPDIKAMAKDLGRLLKASRIG
ncbi:MAG TPA: hypothetical protein VFX05_16495 [Casimicrobiaceae bacterium]|nr:hypothetical protein [Casimicrobiaceae bacterium]